MYVFLFNTNIICMFFYLIQILFVCFFVLYKLYLCKMFVYLHSYTTDVQFAQIIAVNLNLSIGGWLHTVWFHNVNVVVKLL